jgi:hypothetical protein
MTIRKPFNLRRCPMSLLPRCRTNEGMCGNVLIVNQLCNRNGAFAKRGETASEEYARKMCREAEMCQIDRLRLDVRHDR